MLLNNIRLFAIIGAACATMLVACGDDEETDGTTATTTATGTGSGSGTGTGTGGGGDEECVALCTQVFNCGLEMDAGMPLCPAFNNGLDLNTYLNGADGSGGCVETCSGPLGGPLQAQVVDGDCPATVENLSGLSMDFAAACVGDAGEGAADGAGAGSGS
ncbi:MAG: hypothetical protein AAGA56_09120 [Myxococcota bacterium]